MGKKSRGHENLEVADNEVSMAHGELLRSLTTSAWGKQRIHQ